MARERVPASDPVRSIGLLWASQTRPGRSGITVQAIVRAAIEIADADGLDAVSMRQVAQRLGVGAMSLYTHVPAKGELLDLMIDASLGELYTAADELAGAGGWRPALSQVAERNWDLYARHPWLLEVPNARPVLGPNTTLKYEAELRPLEGIGLSDVEMDQALTLVLTHVAGAARARAAVARTERETGESDAQWWLSAGPALAKLINEERFPIASRVGQASSQEYNAASSPERLFEFGLERILDGIAQLIAARP